jgi:hypothetical protein
LDCEKKKILIVLAMVFMFGVFATAVCYAKVWLQERRAMKKPATTKIGCDNHVRLK